MAPPRLSLLLLADDDPRHADTLRQHVAAFRRFSRHRVRVTNPVGHRDPRALDLDRHDVVVFHWSLVVSLDTYLAPPLRRSLAAFDGLKILFLQDEYRWVDAVTASARELGVGLLYTVVPEREIQKLYGERLPDVDVIQTLTGFVPDELLEAGTPPPEERPVDIGYRGRELPFWTGRLAHEKASIVRDVLELAPRHGLVCDIAWREEDRIYGPDWTRFLTRCKATLGTPSGASIVDPDGSVEAAAREYLAGHATASFEEVHAAVLAPHEGSILIDVVSPRMFEAAALRTAMILYPGGYSGILEPGVHYLALERDLSNFGEVAEALRDPAGIRSLTGRAYDDLVASGRWSLKTFVREFDEAVDARAWQRRRRSTPRPRPPRVRVARLRPTVSRLALSAARLRLALAARPVRTLWRRYAADSALRREVTRQQLGDDLLRLGLLIRRDLIQPRFRVLASRGADGGLVLLSERPEAAGPNGAPAKPGPVGPDGASIVWNHSGIGTTVVCSLPAGRRVGVEVGSYRVGGVHRFEALERVARRYPADVARALEAVVADAP